MNKKARVIAILATCLVLIQAAVLAQTDSTGPVFNSKRLKGIVLSESVLYASSLVGLNELWYKDYPKSSFHFFNDNKEWLQMDKMGHATTAYYVGNIGISALTWSGVERKKAIIYGGSLGFLFLTTIEILDGYSSAWGASPGDLLANTLGAGLLMGQELAWNEQRVLLKFSFHQTSLPAYRPEALGEKFTEQLLKDYNGQTYWLSANIRSFCRNEHSRIPNWLNVAVGYGAQGMLGARYNPEFNKTGNAIPFHERYRQYYLSLDIDLTKIKTKYKALNLILNSIGFIKMPFPTVEFNTKGKIEFHPLYF